MMGGGALIAYFVWQQRHLFNFKKREFVFGALAGAVGVISSGTILALALMTAGEAFTTIAETVLIFHIPVMIIEALVVGSSAEFLNKVKPDILAGQRLMQNSNG